MTNFPDDISYFKCPFCKNIIPNCTCDNCSESEKEDKFNKVLFDVNSEKYLEMFCGKNLNELVDILQRFHIHRTEEICKELVSHLDMMLKEQVEKD